MSERLKTDTDPPPRGETRAVAPRAGGRISPAMVQPPRPRSRDNPVIPPAPPLPRLESERPAAGLSPQDTPAPTTLPGSGDARAGLGPFQLDPDFADLISRAISSAISAEIDRVCASLAPAPPTTPVPPAVPGEKAPSEPPRSSIRVAANKAPRWTAYGITLLAVAGQLIVWFGPKLFPHHVGPLVQALKLVGWFLQSLGGHVAPPTDLTP
jgi:hypothetical protein